MKIKFETKVYIAIVAIFIIGFSLGRAFGAWQYQKKYATEIDGLSKQVDSLGVRFEEQNQKQ